jgi:hypothetical protein
VLPIEDGHGKSLISILAELREQLFSKWDLFPGIAVGDYGQAELIRRDGW